MMNYLKWLKGLNWFFATESTCCLFFVFSCLVSNSGAPSVKKCFAFLHFQHISARNVLIHPN